MISVGLYDVSASTIKWEKQFVNNEFSQFTPLLTDKYLIFPIYPHYPDGKLSMQFYDLNGMPVQAISFKAPPNIGGSGVFAYVENGMVYTQATPF